MLPAAIWRPTLQVVASCADTATYNELYELAKSATDPVAKDQYFVALSYARDPALAQRSLDLSLSSDPATTTAPNMIAAVAADNADIAWNFVIEHLAEVNAKLDALQRYNFVPSIGAKSLNPAVLQQLRAFIDQNVPAANRAQVERFYADMEFRLSVRKLQVPEIDKWIQVNG